jgi:hypothetical protein
LAYTAFALDQPVLAGLLLVVALSLTLWEGAFRLYGEAAHAREDAEDELAAYADRAPKLSFARAHLPRDSQEIVVTGMDGNPFVHSFGKVIRVPVTNAQGAGTAHQVHARLRFCTGTGSADSQFVPPPAQGEWVGEHGPEIEIDMPGNGRPRLLDVVVVIDSAYPHGHAWTKESRAAGLSAYAIKSRPFDVVIEIMGSGGPDAPYLQDTLRVDCQENGILKADWLSAGSDEATNWVAR